MMLTPTRSGLFLAITALLASPAVLAQDAPTDPQQQPAQQPPAQLDAIEVRGRFIPEPMLQTSEVASFVTREDLERTGDSSAAQSVSRVSGVSMANEKFVVVRGLNERYTQAMLNGSPLPSTEPMQRVVPLDLFPTDVLAGITVQKTYSVRYPGEFGGGVIDLQSLSIPRRNFFSISFGGGGNSATTGEKGLTHYGSDTDFWGYDDGTRKMPRELADAFASGQFIDANGGHFSLDQVKDIARSLQNANIRLLQEKDSINPDVEFGASGGYVLDLEDSGKLGFIAVAGFENKWRTRFGTDRLTDFLTTPVELVEDYEFAATNNNAKVNVMLGAGWERDSHRIGMTTLYVHDTTKTTRSSSGINVRGWGLPERWDSTGWFERTLISNQLSGKHGFGEYNDLTVEWRLAASSAKRDVPYENRIGYRMDNDGYWMYNGNGIRNSLDFSRVDDKVRSGGIDVTWRLPIEDRDVILSAGLARSENDRNAEWRSLGFMSPDNMLPFYNRYQRVDYLFSDYNISQDLLRLIERTPGQGQAAYDANLTVDAGYLQAEVEFSPVLRATLGGRYEKATQSVTPYSLHVDAPIAATDIVAPLENNYFLPALTVTWNFAENQQLRFGASQTITRPQFREMAPQEYTDPDTFRRYMGNRHLTDSKLLNLDARYEWFFRPGEHITAGLFHKTIDKPIESGVYLAGGGSSNLVQTYYNAPKATLYGIELEAKSFLTEEFPLLGDTFRLFANANYTWSKSSINVKAGDTVQWFMHPEPVDAALWVNDGERMQGQSDHIANLQFGLESPNSRSQAMLIANYVSDRVAARTDGGQPDYMERPGTTVDLVLRKQVPLWSSNATLSFSARNLLDTDYREFQRLGDTSIDVYRYKRGVSYSASVSIAF